MSLYIWRHPRPKRIEGRCLGRTDATVDPRRLRRLAGRIARFARRHRLPREIHVSPLARSREVGELLRRQGWLCRVEPDLAEVDFGHWDGRPWCDIPLAELDAWCADFARHAPGGGESLERLFARVGHWLGTRPPGPVLAVGHAGWINAARLLAGGHPLPAQPQDWPAPVPYQALTVLTTTPGAPSPHRRGSCQAPGLPAPTNR